MRAIAALVLALTLSATPVLAGQDGSIDLFPFGVDPGTGAPTTVDFGACQAQPTSIFGGFFGKLIIGVFARLNGATLAGLSGAEFYVSGLEVAAGLPAGWTKQVIFPAGTIQVGNISEPHMQGTDTLRRLNTTWTDVSGPEAPNCQKDPLVQLARFELQSPFSGTPGGWVNFPNNHYISVLAGNPPAGLPCPVLFLCDAPVFTGVCVGLTGGQFIVNPVGASIQAQCTVAVEEKTWSEVKNLYR